MWIEPDPGWVPGRTQASLLLTGFKHKESYSVWYKDNWGSNFNYKHIKLNVLVFIVTNIEFEFFCLQN